MMKKKGKLDPHKSFRSLEELQAALFPSRKKFLNSVYLKRNPGREIEVARAVKQAMEIMKKASSPKSVPDDDFFRRMYDEEER